ncbi:MAG: glycoside hydrolase [Planctomycetales bacterium]
MKCFTTRLIIVIQAAAITLQAADPPPAFIQASEQRREKIPLGGDFRPAPKAPVFVAVGHGARILLSRDDGKTWKQVFWGHPGSDHGTWATNSVAYTNGVFAVPVGWTFPTTYLASEDGVNWRHLSNGKTKLPAKGEGKAVMPTTMAMAGGNGVFVGSGYMTLTATPDFGKSFSTFSLRSFKDDPRWPPMTHHLKTIYLGDESGRFLAIGDDRRKDNPGLCRVFASDDLGRAWKWLDPKGLKRTGPRGDCATNGKAVVLTDRGGVNAFRSLDGGETWDGPHLTGAQRASLCVVNGEFWLTSDSGSRRSVDGRRWHALPKTTPAGKIAVSDQGTLISIDRGRFNILRSDDDGKTWNEAYRFEPETEHVHGAQGLRDIAFGHATVGPRKP